MKKVIELIESGFINKAHLARIMYPTNAAAPQYLNNKLHNNCTHTFTSKDKELFIKIIKEKFADIIKDV